MKILSLFSGIGAFEKALTNLNTPFEVVNYCEIDKFASCAYSAIHGVSEDFNLGDITKVRTEEIKDFDLLTYGFPCQDISLSGKMHGIIKGETRSGLLYEALRIIKDKKPKYAIAENVSNLVSKKFIADFENMLKELDAMGYNSYWKILNAKDFGIPQNRERVFVISIRKDIDTDSFEFPKGFQSNLRIKDIIEDNVNYKYYLKPDKIKKIKKEIHEKIKIKKIQRTELVQVGKLSDDPNAFNMTNRVYSEEGICPTIMTGSNDKSPKIVCCNVRPLIPIECWRLMGFTDMDYLKSKEALKQKFYKGKDNSDSQMYKMAGNSIVVNVLEHIFKSLFQL